MFSTNEIVKSFSLFYRDIKRTACKPGDSFIMSVKVKDTVAVWEAGGSWSAYKGV